MPHLTLPQRSQLEVLVKLGKKQADIALLLGVSQSTVSRELRRSPGSYDACHAQFDAEVRRAHAYRQRIPWFRSDPVLLREILMALRRRRSPEQIAGERRRLRRCTVSAGTIYAYVWSHPGLDRYLRYRGHRPWRKGVPVLDTTAIRNRRDIAERPKSVETRRRYGDWESDLVIGGGHAGAIATFVERKSRYLKAVLLRHPTSEEFLHAAQKVFRTLPQRLRQTLTHDNGREIAQHEAITLSTGIAVYCAHPYCFWQRGLNEHTNGLLRDYFPKGTDFHTISQRQLDRVVESINTRPRHCLQFRTPKMVFEQVRRRYAFHGSE